MCTTQLTNREKWEKHTNEKKKYEKIIKNNVLYNKNNITSARGGAPVFFNKNFITSVHKIY